MSKLRLTGILLFLIANLTVFGQSDEWNSLTEEAYSIQYPDKWELDKSGQGGN